MLYEIQRLSTELVYIKWTASSPANGRDEKQFIKELIEVLEKSEQPLYFISDLRKGRITGIATLNQLAQISHHKHWAGSTAFGRNPLSSIFVGTFSSLARQSSEHQEMQDTPEQSLAYLESLKPGLTDKIDWNEVLEVKT
jgi:hypothetical protein